VRARVPSTVVASLVAIGILAGSGIAGVAAIHHHPASSSPPPTVVPTKQTNVVRTTVTTSVAPLRHLVQPDLQVTTAHPLSATTIRKLRHVEHARDAVAFDAGTVRVNGHRVHAVAADLSTLRGFTPPPTAASDQLWQNLASGDIAVS